MGLPVIATDCMTGPKEILEDRYGILIPNMSQEENFDAGDISAEECALAGEIISLLENQEKLEHYRQMARKRAGDYTVESYIEKIREWAGV